VLPGEFKRIDAVPASRGGRHCAPDATHPGTDSYAVRGFGLYLEDGTLFAVYGQTDPIWKRQRPPHSTWRSIGNWPPPMPPRSPLATPPLPIRPPPRPCAVAELASLAEALAGAVADKIITPATLAKVLAGYVNAAQLGAPGGVAMLGADGKLAVDQRPPIDLIDVWPVDSQAAMLALAEATVGDFAVRADSGLVYVCRPRRLPSWPTGWRFPRPPRSLRSTAKWAAWC
jgi:hypothetical protein